MTSDPRQPRLDARVAFVDGPQIHRKREEVIDLRNGPGILRQIDRLHVAAAGVAGFDANVRVHVAAKLRQLVWILFETRRTMNSVDVPLQGAESAAQHAQSAVGIAGGFSGADHRRAAAERAMPALVYAVRRDLTCSQHFSVRL